MSVAALASFGHQVVSQVGGGGATTAYVDRKQFDAVNGAVLDTTGTIFTYQPVCMICAGNGTAKNVQWTTNSTGGSISFWWRRATGTLATVQRLVQTTPTGHELRVLTSGILAIGPGGANFTNIFTPTIDAEYWITMSWDQSGNPHIVVVRVFDINLRQVAEQTVTLAAVSATNTAVNVGITTNISNVTTYHGGLVLDDQPRLLGPRKVHILLPTGDGTHSYTDGTPDDFQNATPADYPSGHLSTTIWNDVKEVPPNTTAFVQQVVIRSTGYVEFVHGSLPSSGYGAPDAVQVFGAYHPVAAATANTSATRLNDNGTITSEAVIDRSVASNTLEFARTLYQTRPSTGDTWTQSAVNALRTRYGFSTDATPPPALDAIFLEVSTPIKPSLLANPRRRFPLLNR